MWSEIEIASSVNLLGRFANWSGSRVSWDYGVDMSHDQPFRLEGKMNGSKYRAILDENLLQSAQTMLKVHFPTGQRP